MIQKILEFQNKIIPNNTKLLDILLLIFVIVTALLFRSSLAFFILIVSYINYGKGIFAIDKKKCFYMGIIYSIVGFLVGYSIGIDTNLCILLFPLLYGLSKELNDKISDKGDAELLDFLATILPAIFIIF